MDSENNNPEDSQGAYEDSPIKLETLIEFLAKIALLFLLVCIGIIFVLFRIVYAVGLILLQTIVTFGTVPKSIVDSLVSFFCSPIETVTVVLKLSCVSVLVGFGFLVEIFRLSVKNVYRIINALVLTVRYLIGLTFLLMGVLTAMMTVSLGVFIFCVSLITRVLLYTMIIAYFKYWIEPVPNDDIWTNLMSLLPIQTPVWMF